MWIIIKHFTRKHGYVNKQYTCNPLVKVSEGMICQLEKEKDDILNVQLKVPKNAENDSACVILVFLLFCKYSTKIWFFCSLGVSFSQFKRCRVGDHRSYPALREW